MSKPTLLSVGLEKFEKDMKHLSCRHWIYDCIRDFLSLKHKIHCEFIGKRKVKLDADLVIKFKVVHIHETSKIVFTCDLQEEEKLQDCKMNFKSDWDETVDLEEFKIITNGIQNQIHSDPNLWFSSYQRIYPKIQCNDDLTNTMDIQITVAKDKEPTVPLTSLVLY